MNGIGGVKYKAICAIDFDGTIAEPPGTGFAPGSYGEPVRKAVKSIQRLKKLGYGLIVWTCRGGEDIPIAEYMNRHDIPFDAINENLVDNDNLFPGFTRSPKIIADFYVDDRGIGWRGWSKAMQELDPESRL